MPGVLSLCAVVLLAVSMPAWLGLQWRPCSEGRQRKPEQACLPCRLASNLIATSHSMCHHDTGLVGDGSSKAQPGRSDTSCMKVDERCSACLGAGMELA